MLVVQSDLNTEQALSWLDNKLNFTSVPLRKVFEEIGRQYGILINIPENLDSIYTGTFYKDTPVEQTLDLVCKPFHLTYTLKSKDEYIITRNEQKLNHKKVLISLFFFFLVITSFSQEIRITGIDEPLNKILINLRDDYGLMMSFDDRQLSSYKLTLDKKFASPVTGI